ncbi:hypothetical protein [uncultured Exiguobacterium sp.]|uniref:hypothetical protein n=1 Tax=uncultured Exiguobacterium sp. TaxID=202669 RepID=UPI0025F89602|nr:hypothetical protein [uncultured Exiguobacterium sp.]
MLGIQDHGGKFTGFTGKTVKSIQRGSIAPFNNTTVTTVTVPITAVDFSKSIIRISYNPVGTSGNTAAVYARLLETGNSFNLERYASTSVMSQTIYWEVIEFENVKSKQSGFNGVSSGAATISAVDTSKCLLYFSQLNINSANTGFLASEFSSAVYLSNSTTLNFIGSSTSLVGWQIIEFK